MESWGTTRRARFSAALFSTSRVAVDAERDVGQWRKASARFFRSRCDRNPRRRHAPSSVTVESSRVRMLHPAEIRWPQVHYIHNMATGVRRALSLELSSRDCRVFGEFGSPNHASLPNHDERRLRKGMQGTRRGVICCALNEDCDGGGVWNALVGYRIADRRPRQ